VTSASAWGSGRVSSLSLCCLIGSLTDELVSEKTRGHKGSDWQIDACVCVNIKTAFVHGKHSQRGIVQLRQDREDDSSCTAPMKMHMHMHKPLVWSCWIEALLSVWPIIPCMSAASSLFIGGVESSVPQIALWGELLSVQPEGYSAHKHVGLQSYVWFFSFFFCVY